jgi:DNA modification methylase
MLQLLNGDCLEILKGLPDKSVDCFICDLPYGCLTQPKGNPGHKKAEANGGQMNGCAWDVALPLEPLWAEIKRLAKDAHTPVLMFCTTKFGYDLIKSNERWFRYDLVWDKQRGVSFLSANKMPMRSHEMIYVFSKAGAYYKRVDISGNFQAYSFKATDYPPAFNGSKGLKKRTETQNDGSTRCVLSVIQTPNKTLRKSAHPTEKPQDLYRWLIERYCPEGGTILDPTAGSFNSCFAAVAAGRKAIGIEKDATFFKKAKERAEAAGLLEPINEIISSPQ